MAIVLTFSNDVNLLQTSVCDSMGLKFSGITLCPWNFLMTIILYGSDISEESTKSSVKILGVLDSHTLILSRLVTIWRIRQDGEVFEPTRPLI